MSSTTERVAANDESQLRQLIAEQASAIGAKDVDRLMSLYDDDVVAFDVKPPYQSVGAAAWRQIWEECLPYYPETFQLENRDLRLSVAGDVAFAHWLGRFTGMEPDHPAMQTWLRFTACYRKIDGTWRIVHEHCSVPFDPHTGAAVFTLDP